MNKVDRNRHKPIKIDQITYYDQFQVFLLVLCLSVIGLRAKYICTNLLDWTHKNRGGSSFKICNYQYSYTKEKETLRKKPSDIQGFFNALTSYCSKLYEFSMRARNGMNYEARIDARVSFVNTLRELWPLNNDKRNVDFSIGTLLLYIKVMIVLSHETIEKP